MKTVWVFLLLSLCGCVTTVKRERPAPSDTAPIKTVTAVESLELALKAHLYTEKVYLSGGSIGSDATYDYGFFFAGWEIQGGFESIYYQDVLFVKKKTDSNWLEARIFIVS